MYEFLDPNNLEVQLMREILHLLIYEEHLIEKGMADRRKEVSKERFAARRHLRDLKRFGNQLDLFESKEEADNFKEVSEVLQIQISNQRRRNFNLLKERDPGQAAPALQPEGKKKVRVQTIERKTH